MLDIDNICIYCSMMSGVKINKSSVIMKDNDII